MTDDSDHNTHPRKHTRRGFLAATGMSAAAAVAPRQGTAGTSDEFEYEVTRTEAEWREMLNDEEYRIMREGGTELPASSALWSETRQGNYCCKGCDLLVYRGAWREPVEKGWVFFRHCETNTVLTSIDGPVAEYGMTEYTNLTMIEAHCRRCASHLGHILIVEDMVLHCINGNSLTFAPLT